MWWHYEDENQHWIAFPCKDNELLEKSLMSKQASVIITGERLFEASFSNMTITPLYWKGKSKRILR